MIILMVLLLLLTLFNTALLLALCGAMTKLLRPEEPASPAGKSFVSDTPVPRQANYADFLSRAPLSTDIRLVKDE